MDFKETEDVKYVRYKNFILHNYTIDRDGNIYNLNTKNYIGLNSPTVSIRTDDRQLLRCAKVSLLRYTFQLDDLGLDYLEFNDFIENENEKYLRYKGKLLSRYIINKDGVVRTLKYNQVLKPSSSNSYFLTDNQGNKLVASRNKLLEYTFYSNELYDYMSKPIIIDFKESDTEKYPIYDDMIFNTYSITKDGVVKDLKSGNVVIKKQKRKNEYYVNLYKDYKLYRVYISKCIKDTFYNNSFEESEDVRYIYFDNITYHNYTIDRDGNIFNLQTRKYLNPSKNKQINIYTDTNERHLLRVDSILRQTFLFKDFVNTKDAKFIEYEGIKYDKYIIYTKPSIKIVSYSTGEMKLLCNFEGLYYVNLVKDGKHIAVLLEKLVAINFLDKPKDKDYLIHKNCNRNDCRVDNLEWVSKQDYEDYKKRRYLYKRGIDVNNILSQYYINKLSKTDICKLNNIHNTVLSDILSNPKIYSDSIICIDLEDILPNTNILKSELESIKGDLDRCKVSYVLEKYRLSRHKLYELLKIVI